MYYRVYASTCLDSTDWILQSIQYKIWWILSAFPKWQKTYRNFFDQFGLGHIVLGGNRYAMTGQQFRARCVYRIADENVFQYFCHDFWNEKIYKSIKYLLVISKFFYMQISYLSKNTSKVLTERKSLVQTWYVRINLWNNTFWKLINIREITEN